MENIDAVTWKNAGVADGKEANVSQEVDFEDDDDMGVAFDDDDVGVVFDDDDDGFQDGWGQMGAADDDESSYITVENLFPVSEEESAASMYIDKKLQVIVMPVQLKTKTVKVYLTQDSEYCKLYLTDVLGSLPKDVSMMVGDTVWVLPRAYPVQNSRLLNKLFFKAQQANAEQKDMVETLSIRDIMAAATNDTSELNYINSQLTLVDMTEESEFGGHV